MKEQKYKHHKMLIYYQCPFDNMHLCVKKKINMHFNSFLYCYYYHDYYLVWKVSHKRCGEV